MTPCAHGDRLYPTQTGHPFTEIDSCEAVTGRTSRLIHSGKNSGQRREPIGVGGRRACAHRVLTKTMQPTVVATPGETQ